MVNDDESVRTYKGQSRPIFPLAFRLRALRALSAVSAVHAFDQDTPLELLSQLRPEIHVKGGSYEEERVRSEKELLQSWGGRLEFCPLVGKYSTSELIRRTGSARSTP